MTGTILLAMIVLFVVIVTTDVRERYKTEQQKEWEFIRLTCKDKAFGGVEPGSEICAHKDRAFKRVSDSEARCEIEFCPKTGGRYET